MSSKRYSTTQDQGFITMGNILFGVESVNLAIYFINQILKLQLNNKTLLKAKYLYIT